MEIFAILYAVTENSWFHLEMAEDSLYIHCVQKKAIFTISIKISIKFGKYL